MTHFTSDDIVSSVPLYNYAFFCVAFFVFFVSLFLGNTKKVYDIQNNAVCFHDVKNLSIRLC